MKMYEIINSNLSGHSMYHGSIVTLEPKENYSEHKGNRVMVRSTYGNRQETLMVDKRELKEIN